MMPSASFAHARSVSGLVSGARSAATCGDRIASPSAMHRVGQEDDGYVRHLKAGPSIIGLCEAGQVASTLAVDGRAGLEPCRWLVQGRDAGRRAGRNDVAGLEQPAAATDRRRGRRRRTACSRVEPDCSVRAVDCSATPCSACGSATSSREARYGPNGPKLGNVLAAVEMAVGLDDLAGADVVEAAIGSDAFERVFLAEPFSARVPITAASSAS